MAENVLQAFITTKDKKKLILRKPKQIVESVEGATRVRPSRKYIVEENGSLRRLDKK